MPAKYSLSSDEDKDGIQQDRLAGSEEYSCNLWNLPVNNGKKKQLRGIILYIRLIQKIEIFLEKWKIIVICLFLKRILKNSPGQILGNKAKQITLSFQPVQNIIYNKMKLCSETGNVGGFQSIMRLGKSSPAL